VGDGGGFIAECGDFVGELASVGVGAVEQVGGDEEDEERGGDGSGEALDVPAGEDGGEASKDGDDGEGGEDGGVVVESGEAIQWDARDACRCGGVERGG